MIRGLTLFTLIAVTAGVLKIPQDRRIEAIAVVETSTLSPGGQGRLKITLKMAEDLHVNANIVEDPNLIPTTFTPKELQGIVWGKPQYPESSKVTEWYSTEPLSVFQDGAIITVPFTIEKKVTADSLTLSGILRAQACDHEQCYPPRRIEVTAQLVLSKK